MTIKELKERLEERLKDEKELARFAVSKYGTGLHEGSALGLQEALLYISYLEVSNAKSND